MPYIALQLVGIQAVLEVTGLGGSSVLARDLPLLISFAVLAAYTYSSGLRAPAMIAFVKDIQIYIVIAVAVIYLPMKLGGWHGIFDAAQTKMAAPSAANPKVPTGAFIPSPAQHWAYASLALGSAMALFMYPHCVTATLSSKDRSTGRRNAAILPAYSLLLGLLALLGYVAIKAGTKPIGLDGKANPQLVIPQLFADSFPSWFTGVAFGAIAVGALVPAAIMSIAAANLFTRNIYKAYLKPGATDAQEAKVSKIVSLITKLGALLFVLALDKQNALNFQLLGGMWILQTLPAIVFGLFTRWCHRWALLAGWAAGMIYGTVISYGSCTQCTLRPFANSLAIVPGLGDAGYIGLTALVLNIAVVIVLSAILNAAKLSNGSDITVQSDYFADIGDPKVQPVVSEELPIHP
jgi:SSS family solute:Na+ symporter